MVTKTHLNGKVYNIILVCNMVWPNLDKRCGKNWYEIVYILFLFKCLLETCGP